MTLDIIAIPCLSDNYAYLARDTENGAVALVDAPEAGPVLKALESHGWVLSLILLTHHHYDHVDGLAGVLARHPAPVIGAAADAHRLPPLDRQVAEGDQVLIGDEAGVVIDVPGHTIGHIAFHFPQSAVVFTADSLMALGCGRVFEGTMPQMWNSLQKLAALPPATLVCSGHEYTQSNARFAVTVDPANAALQARAAKIDAARAQGRPTVPSRLSEELATNPFLRAADPGIRAHLGLENASDAEVFAEIRTRKDNF